MSQQLKLKIRGLYTDPNSFSEVPEGALAKATNVVIDKDSIVESRRGQTFYGNLLDAEEQVNKLFNYRNSLIVSYGNKLAYDSDNAGTWIDYPGTYSQPDSNYKMRSVQANRNFYFTTSYGVQKLDSLTGTPVDAGAIKALGGTASLSGVSGFMATNTQIAYRIVWGYKDANDNLILGSPSQRIIVTNSSGGTRDVSLTFQIPAGITTNWFYQLYRSPESASSSSEPTDELQLVLEDNPTSGEISAKAVTAVDTTPDSLKGATLYTSPSQEGMKNANEQPPFAMDIDLFKGYTLYANTKSKQRLTLTLVSVGGTDGIAVSSTVTINGVTYTGVASAPSNNQFVVVTGGTPAENIQDTALNLIDCINKSTTNVSLYAYYLSGYNDLPGKILFEERDVGGTVYYATSSKGTAFNPTLPVSGTDVSSSSDEAPNRVYISKFQQPEAVPLLNYLDFGSKDFPIRRIIALRDSTFVLKDDGIFRLIGEDLGSFRAVLADNTAIVKAPDAAVAFNNQIMMFSSQGVISVSDSGVSVLSRPIESTLIQLSSDEYPAFENTTFAVSYESDRKYIFFTITEKSDTSPTQAFVFNSFTNSWTRWNVSRTCGLVSTRDDKLYLGTTSGYAYVERKSYTLNDYADEQYGCSIVSSDGYEVELADASAAVIGKSLGQGASSAVITSINGNTLTVDRLQTWAAGSAFLYIPIVNEVQWLPLDIGNPGVLKHFREITLFFRDASFRSIDTKFSSNFSQPEETITLVPVQSGAWGSFPWGSVVWGGSLGGTQALRTYVALDKARASWLNLSLVNRQAFTSMSLSGVSLVYEVMSERFF